MFPHLQEHKAFELDLESYKPEMQRLQDAASVLASSPERDHGDSHRSNGHVTNGTNGTSPTTTTKTLNGDGRAAPKTTTTTTTTNGNADGHHLDLVVEKWDSLWDMSLVYLQRLKSAEIVLAGRDGRQVRLARDPSGRMGFSGVGKAQL